MTKMINLCKPCAELMKDGYSVKEISHPVNNKVQCAHCNRRRYGATYEMTPIRKKDSGGADR